MIVVDPGFKTTVQDLGRVGHYDKGIPPSGAMDKYAYRLGNKLLANDETAAAFELTFKGGAYEFQISTVIAVTGANMAPTLNEEDFPMWETVSVDVGDVLEFGPLESGCRAYLCVSGGVDVPVDLGSRSTYLMGNANFELGGFNGRALETGDEVPLFGPNDDAKPGRQLADEFVPEYSAEWELGFVFGFESQLFTEEAKADFLTREWPVNNRSDRSAYRFNNQGDPLTFVDRERPYGAGDDPSNVVHSPYPVGGVHVPSGQEPILLLHDAVSFGGFATLGTVPLAHLNRTGQIKPGDTVHFSEMTVADAITAYSDWRDHLSSATIHEP